MENEMKNDRLAKPMIRRGKVFDIYDWEKYVIIRGDQFIPTWDSTDHLQFACMKCKTIAEVGMVEVRGGEDCLALYFALECPNCRGSGQRKIYLQPEDERIAFCHHTYDGKKILAYGKGRSPDFEMEKP